MSKHLNLTVIFQASNLNYGESFGNIMSLKKIISGGKNYSYISRQALRYDLVRIMNQYGGMPLTKVQSSKKEGEAATTEEKLMIQFARSTRIDKYPEIDLFGYMKTAEGNGNTFIRKAKVRLSDAISLEPFNNEIDFSTNMGLAHRGEEIEGKIENISGNNIFQSEIHRSFYSYTLTVDLDEIGIDENKFNQDDQIISIPNKDKAKRVNLLLESIKGLYRDIKGKRENLAPLFIIGGIYNFGNPPFYNRLSLSFKKNENSLNNKPFLNIDIINEILNKSFFGEHLLKSTLFGIEKSIFGVEKDKKINLTENTIENFFQEIKNRINLNYNI